MSRYLIASRHTEDECLRAMDATLAKGTNVLDKFVFGCKEGDHTGYAIADVKSAAIETAGSPGTGTIGYWKNHPEAWPARQLTVRGRLYPRGGAPALMATPGRGDKTYDLFRQLAAALLNTLAGTDASCIAAVLAAADDWLAEHEPGSGVRSEAPAWREAGAEHASTGNPLRVAGWEEWDLDDDMKVAASRGWYDADDYARQTTRG